MQKTQYYSSPKDNDAISAMQIMNKIYSSEEDGDSRLTVNEVHNGSKNNRCEKTVGEQLRSDQGKDLSLSKSD